MKKTHMMLVFIVLSLSLILNITSSKCYAAEDLKPITLKYGTFYNSTSWHGELHQWWANEVEKRTGGKVKINIFWMESLFKYKDALPAVQMGIGDMGWISMTYHPSHLPLSLLTANPFNFRGDYVAAVLAILDTMENEPNWRGELEKANIIQVVSHIGGYNQLANKKCYKSLADLKGQTIRVYGGARAKYWEYLGANPVLLSYADIYEAVDRGTVSGFDMALLASHGLKHYEVTKCILNMNNGGAIGDGIFMNYKTFKSFPLDVQKMFIDLRKEYGIKMAQKLMDDEEKYYKEWEIKYGIKRFDLSPEDQKTNIEAGKKAIEFTINKQESDGHSGARKLWDYYTNTLKKYEDQRVQKK
jgi:TRAP-type transport system periplasmic protein